MKPGEGTPLILPLPEGYRPEKDLYPPHEYKEHRWAMVVDLDRCIGCGACAVACYAENNMAVVGEPSTSGAAITWRGCGSCRTATRRTRGGWASCPDVPALRRRPVRAGLPGLRLGPQRGGPERPGLQPLHRHAVLLEQLPVQGAAVQLVRTTSSPKPLDWQLNPEVTVRVRGVMEKCTFCIQRIRAAEYRAKTRGPQGPRRRGPAGLRPVVPDAGVHLRRPAGPGGRGDETDAHRPAAVSRAGGTEHQARRGVPAGASTTG